MPEETGALVLMAAGASRRMMRPKQLLTVEGVPLIVRVVQGLSGAQVSPFLVVLGANHDVVRSALSGLPVEVVENPGWLEGLGSSIREGVRVATTRAPETPWLIIGLGDQPDFSADHLSALCRQRQLTGRGIVATQCDGVLMPPMLFDRRYFPSLLQLWGDAGGRRVVNEHRDDLATVEVFDWVDLDTPADYDQYLKRPAKSH